MNEDKLKNQIKEEIINNLKKKGFMDIVKYNKKTGEPKYYDIQTAINRYA